MPFTQLTVHELLKQFQISQHDLSLLREFGEHEEVSIETLISDFYRWLEQQVWYPQFFEAGVPDKVKALQSSYWRDFIRADINDTYVERRVIVGKVHATINLPVTAYLAGMNFCQMWFANIAHQLYGDSAQCIQVQGIINRLCQMDANTVMHVYSSQSIETIRQQGELTAQIVNEVTRVVEAVSIGDYNVRYAAQEQDDYLEHPINQLVESLSMVASQARDISEGNYDIQVAPRNDKDELGKAMSQMVASLREIGAVAESVAKGNYQVQIPEKSEKDRLSRALNQMVESLAEFSAQSNKEKWIKSGLAELAVVLREGVNVEELADKSISFLAHYLNAQLGLFYSCQNDGNLTLEASYAHTRRKHLNNHIQIGEGLVGQALKERAPILLSQVPKDYITIHSGLGETTPTNIIVQPLIYEDTVSGVIELGTLNEFSDEQLELLKQISETIAVAIKSAQNRETMQQLLEESQQTSEELQAQQDELKAANEMLEEQADALKRSEEELTEQKDMLEHSNQALRNKTQDLEAQKSEIEQARQELQLKAEQLATSSQYKSDFLANMSHELRTPLNSLLILSQSLIENRVGNLNSEQVEDLKVIHDGGQTLLALINDILDLAKVEAGKLKLNLDTVNLTQLVQHLESQLLPVAKQKGLSFTVKMEDAPNTLEADCQRLEQILRNLLANALKFTDTGTVQLEVQTLNDHQNQPNHIAFHITDSGAGIPEDKQQAIFEAFQQADGSTSRAYGGTGLGLTIAREMALRMGGEIKLHSQVGQGSRFSLILPYQAEQPMKNSDTLPIFSSTDHTAVVETPTSEPPAPLPVAPLLIVEEDAELSEQLQEMASKKGFSCLMVTQGEEAISLAQQQPLSAIILNVGLAGSKGLEVLDTLQSDPLTCHIPIHLISGEEVVPEVVQKGAFGLLTKPTDAKQLQSLFTRFSTLAQGDICHLLLVEDDHDSSRAIRALLAPLDLDILTANTGAEAIHCLQQEKVDCCILDLTLPDMNGNQFLEQVDQDPTLQLPPTIIYTGRDLDDESYRHLMQYANRIVIKGEHSPERLLDEVALFLHKLTRSKHHPEPLPATQHADLIGRHILLVDDDLRNTYALTKVLQDNGFKVIIADNGELALNKLRENSDIELVLMDIMMPVMDGYEATRIIRSEISPSLPIIALTAKAMPDDKRLCMEAGANDYLSKPVNVTQLIAMVRIWLSQ